MINVGNPVPRWASRAQLVLPAGEDTKVKERSAAGRFIVSDPRFSRRTLLSSAAAATLAASTDGPPVAAHYPASVDDLSSVELPPDLGQSELTVYVAETGHTLQGVMLDYWRANGATTLYGNPISEPFAAPNGYYSQAFERGIFQYRPEFLYTADPFLRLMPIGRLALQERVGTFRNGRRWSGGDPRIELWRRLDASEDAVATVLAEGGVFDETTGHTISGDILAWYSSNEGAFYLGAPLTEPRRERGSLIQWFEGGLLRADEDGVALAPLASKFAIRFGLDTTPVPQGDLPAYDELLFWTADNPNPLGDPYAPGGKWVEVSVPQQLLTAYHDSTPISSTLVSTGLAPNLTETGMFHVRLKYPVQDMKGFTSATGEVLAVGEDGAPADAVAYDVPAVPNVMYFNMEGEALHGTYWHNNFGEPMSHGCVNLPLDFAAWMYGWAPLGTAVWVHG